MEVRLLTRVRRIIQAVRYDLRPEIPSVPCDTEGNPRVKSFNVSLYKTIGDDAPNLHRTTKLRYRRKSSDGTWTAWIEKQDSDTISVQTGVYVLYEIEAYHGGSLLTSLGVSTTLDGRIGNKGAKQRIRVWDRGHSYMQGKDKEEWYDFALYRDDEKKPYERYLCLISHGPRNITPKEDVAQKLGYWAAAAEFEFIATRLILAERITAEQIDVDSIFSGTIQAHNATIDNFNASNVKITSGSIGGFEIADGRIGVEDITKGIGIIISTNAIGVHLDNRMTGKVIAGLGDFALSSDATRGEALIVKQTIPGGKSHGITRSTALIEVHGGDNPSYEGRPGAGGRQVGLRIITDNGDKDIALDIKGRVRVFDRRNPLADLFGVTITATYEGWDTNGKPAQCHLNFIDGILTGISFSPR